MQSKCNELPTSIEFPMRDRPSKIEDRLSWSDVGKKVAKDGSGGDLYFSYRSMRVCSLLMEDLTDCTQNINIFTFSSSHT
jgi:hypothetical protein